MQWKTVGKCCQAIILEDVTVDIPPAQEGAWWENDGIVRMYFENTNFKKPQAFVYILGYEYDYSKVDCSTIEFPEKSWGAFKFHVPLYINFGTTQSTFNYEIKVLSSGTLKLEIICSDYYSKNKSTDNKIRLFILILDGDDSNVSK